MFSLKGLPWRDIVESLKLKEFRSHVDMALAAQETNPGLQLKQSDQQGKGGDPALLLCSSPGVLQPVQAGPEKGQKSDQKDRTHLL